MKIRHDHSRRALIHTAAAEREGGYVLVMFALLLIPLLLFVGFSVDVGSWYNRASDMQKAADAASLAGVVWLPDEAKAREVALATAKKNGFDDDDPNIDVIVAKSPSVPNRLQVSIRDRRVGSFIYSNIGGSDLDMSRKAFAEYITPVPMGSPRNYFGTGSLLSGDWKEELYQSVNTYCSSKANGDRHQSANDSGQSSNFDVRGSCGNRGNADFRTQGYELYIDAVEGRPSDIELRLLDPQMNTQVRVMPGEVIGETCTTTWAYTWPANIGSGWTIHTSNGRVTGPRQYQTRNTNTSSTWSPNPPNFVAEGQQSGNLTGNRYRSRTPLTSTPTTTCVPNYGPSTNHAALDRYFNTTSGTPRPPETFTVTLARPDSTPLNDVDNPVICTMEVTPTTPYEDYTYLGSARWLEMRDELGNRCPITTGMRSGRYILRIRNAGAAAATTPLRADGENNWGLVARYSNATGDGVCDGRFDLTCPRVYGKDAISVRAVADATTADFFLAEIEPFHAGKRLRIELWDPGEGGNSIEILRPDGPNAWTPVSFSWSEPSQGSGTTALLEVRNSSGDRFNARLLSITVDLTGYSPDPGWNNHWWKIRYRFRPGVNVTDRTTWSARILGDPVHLIEE